LGNTILELAELKSNIYANVMKGCTF